MEWLFALGIIFMTAVNRPFRKRVFWTLSVSTAAFLLVGWWALAPLK